MENAIKDAIKEGRSGNKRYFYDAFRSKGQNEKLRALQLEAYEDRRPEGQANTRAAFKGKQFRLMAGLLPIGCLYASVYFFNSKHALMAVIALFVFLGGALFFIWRLNAQRA